MDHDMPGMGQGAGSPASPVLSREFAEFREEIGRLLRRADWSGLVEDLARLNRMAEGAGYREICLRSQSVIDLLGRCGAGRETPGGRVLELLDLLLAVLAHSEWRERERIGAAPSPGAEALSRWENPAPRGSPWM